VTNLDFVDFLLEEGADPNAQDHVGWTPLMYGIPDGPGAAKFLLNWPTTDANMLCQSRESFLAKVRSAIADLYERAVRPDIPSQVQLLD
jgi:hypothetical protein